MQCKQPPSVALSPSCASASYNAENKPVHIFVTTALAAAQRMTRLGTRPLLWLIPIALLTACAAPPPSESKPEHLYWPALPEQPRYLHETTLRNAQDIAVLTDTERMQHLLTGASATTDPVMGKPFAVAARAGRIMVTDTRLGQVHVFDIPRRRYFRLGYRLEGALSKPMDIEINDDGQVYVVDAIQRRVVIYDASGLYKREIALDEDITHATGLAVTANGSRLFVVDTGRIDSTTHKIVVYDDKGKRLLSFGQRGAKNGEFNLPVDAVVSVNNELYVLDAGNFRVQVFDLKGKYLRGWGSVGNGFGQFSRPRSIAADSDGNIYVSDAQFGNVQVFTPQGQLLIALGRQSLQDEPGRFTLLAGITVDETNRLYALDQRQLKIEVIRRLSDAQGKQIMRAAPPARPPEAQKL